MKKTKVKFLLICIISVIALLCIGGKVEAATGYTVKYDEKKERKVLVTISFDEEINTDKVSSSWTVKDKKTITGEFYGLSWGYETITMSDDSKIEIEYATPAVLYMYGATISPSSALKDYKIADESIVKFNDNEYLEAVKPGKTQITATYTNTKGDVTKNVTWDVTVKYPTAEDWTDFSKVTYSVSEDYSDCRLFFSNMTEKKSHYYWIFMGNQNANFREEDTVFYGAIDASSPNYISIGSNDSKVMSSSINKWIEKSGDIYFQIIESYRPENCNTYANKVVMKKTKLDRPEYKIGTRLLGYYFDEYTSTFNHTPYTEADKRVLKLKIGRINDTNILRSIKNGESGCMEKLMEYAKKADSIYTGQVPIGRSESIARNINMVDDEYLYVYMVLEDENKEFYTIEDIGLYQACISDSVGKNLWSSLDTNFIWNIPEESNNNGTEKPSNDETPKETKEEQKEAEKTTEDSTKDPTVTPSKIIPQAGESMIVVAVIATLGVVVFVSYKGFKNIRVK